MYIYMHIYLYIHVHTGKFSHLAFITIQYTDSFFGVARLGYGKKGSGPEIPPNATLDFTVTLVSISK